MASVKLIHVDKFYTKENQVVFDFNIDIKDKEFIVFVGPSGCGKSTTLRMIAGLEDITSGELYIDDVLSNQIQAKDRGISMVFQSYALFPNMTVRKNIAYGLSIRKFPYEVHYKDGTKVMIIDKKKIKEIERQIKHIKKDIKYANADIQVAENDDERINAQERLERLNVLEEKFNKQLEFYKTTPVPKIFYKHNPKDETAKRVEEIAEALELTPYLERKPNQLSGGQRQRVALGRAIARKAKVFLMDEPLSNLDAKLRVQMRKEITALHKRLGATTIYVTHDQLEAMTMADRIVVMKKGVVQQLDTPTVIYDHPANLFVATFIGSPTINLIDAVAKKGELIFANNKLVLEGEQLSKVKSYDNANVILGIRPEDIITSLPNKIEKNDKNTWYDAEVTLVEILGNDSIIHFMVGDKDFQTFSEDQEIVLGSKIKYRFRNERIHMFEKDSEITIF